MPLKPYSPRRTLTEVTDTLRTRIAAGVHSGRIGPGDPLGSIRGAAREIGCDHRLVAAAYRALEGEGLVEVRDRSGVFIAAAPGRAEPATETGRLFARSLVEGWSRRIPVPELLELAARQAARSAIRCLLLESVTDAMEEYAEELATFWGLEVERAVVPEASGAAAAGDGWTDLQLDRLAAQHGGVDLIVTTSFHVRLGRAASRALQVPLVILSADMDAPPFPDQAGGARFAVLCLDPRYGDRMQGEMAHGGSESRRVRVIAVTDSIRAGPPDPLEPVFMTRAVRQRFPAATYPVFPAARILCSRSAMDLANALVLVPTEPVAEVVRAVPLRVGA